MKKILIRPKDIKNCWETKDACIVEQYDGKKWVCEKELPISFLVDNQVTNNTLKVIRLMEDNSFIELPLKQKGKSE